MAANLLKMDAVALVAAAQTHDQALERSVLDRHREDTAELAKSVADVAVLLAGTGAHRTAITGYLDFVGANGNGKRT